MAVSDYLKGTGAVGDPYVIHNKTALLQWLTSDFSLAGKYAVLVADIDLAGSSVGSTDWRGTLEGNGFSIKSASFTSFKSIYCTIKKLSLVNPIVTTTGDAIGLYSGGVIEDVYITGGSSGKKLMYNAGGIVRRLVSNSPLLLYGATNSYAASCYFLAGAPSTPTAGTNLISSPTPFLPSNYPALTAESNTWVVDGASAPRLLKQDVVGLTQGYLVKGVIKVGGIAKPRFVRALSLVDFARINDGVASADGSFSLKCGFYSDAVMLATYEPYGALLVASKAYVLGDIIHPATPNGFRYLCTTAGNSGTTLPPEPWSTTAHLTVGAALFTPDPVFQPQLHGPIKPVLCDLITGLPV